MVALMTAASMGGDDLQYEHRLEPTSFDRMEALYPHTGEASNTYRVPEWVILGTIYNESNAHPEVKGDGGRAWGLGQTHCFWIHEIETPAETCPDLLNPRQATMTTSAVLRHLRDHYGGGLTWRATIKYYHLGPQAPHQRDRAYIERTRYFGRLFAAHHRAQQTARTATAEPTTFLLN